MAEEYLTGPSSRQKDLETAIKWISARDGVEIEDYMSKHQHNTNCNELWLYFQSVINWVRATFPNYRAKLMKGQDYGILYNKYGKNTYDHKAFETRIVELLDDEDVSNQKGIYAHLLDGQEKHYWNLIFKIKFCQYRQLKIAF